MSQFALHPLYIYLAAIQKNPANHPLQPSQRPTIPCQPIRFGCSTDSRCGRCRRSEEMKERERERRGERGEGREERGVSTMSSLIQCPSFSSAFFATSNPGDRSFGLRTVKQKEALNSPAPHRCNEYTLTSPSLEVESFSD